MSKPVEAITFDAAGTLFFPKPSVGAVYQEVLAAHEVALDSAQLEGAFHTALKKVKKNTSIADSEARERFYWKTVVAESIQPLALLPDNFDTIFEALWQEFAKGSRWTLDEDANEVFDTLDEMGIPFALLTNWDSRVRSVVSGHGLQNRFSHIFVSSEIGFEKPDRGIFDFAARSLNVHPNRILHIGDHPIQDIRGAQNAGWRALQYTPKSPVKAGNSGALFRLRELSRFLNSD